jgi:hypothetical protein
MAVCRSTKANGDPCTLPANGPQGFCWAHDPANREKRRRMASKAARSKPSKEIQRVKAELRETIEAVRDDSMDRGTGAVIGGLYNTLLRALQVQRQWHEADELERRLQVLEQQADQERGVSSWG